MTTGSSTMVAGTAAADSYLYDRVARLITEMIDSGALRPGDRVPSLRRMSRQLDVSIATVMQAYGHLERQGLVEARPQSGFYVRAGGVDPVALPSRTRPRSVARDIQLGDLVSALLRRSAEPGNVPLGLTLLDTGLMPVRALGRCTARVATDSAETAAEYGEPFGFTALRQQIAVLHGCVGHVVDPAELVVTSGCSEALTVALSAVTRPGDTVAVESPTYFVLLRIIEEIGLKAVEIPVAPATGMCLDSLERVLDNVPVAAVLTVPNFNNPFGSLMPEESKARLAALAASRDLPVIEDDIYGDLYFGDARPRTIGSFDTSGNVITCSSLSKTLAPGYRIGWVAPGRFGDRVRRRKYLNGVSTASVTQLAVTEFLRGGGYGRHLKRLRVALRQQVEMSRFAVARHFPAGTRVSRPEGGFFLWIELPAGCDSEVLFQQALDAGVSIMPGTVFAPSRKYRNCIRISCGLPWSERVESAIATVGRLAGG